MTNFFDKISAYKNGDLSSEEIISFEREMASNDLLKRAVVDFDLVEMVGDAIFEEETQTFIDKAMNDHQKPSYFTNSVKVVILVAAIFIGGYFILDSFQKSHKRDQLIAMVVADLILPQVIFTRSGAETGVDNLTAAQEAFSKRDFEKSKKILLSLSLKGEQNDEKNFLLAYIYFIERKFFLSQERIDHLKSAEYLSRIEDLQKLLNKL